MKKIISKFIKILIVSTVFFAYYNSSLCLLHADNSNSNTNNISLSSTFGDFNVLVEGKLPRGVTLDIENVTGINTIQNYIETINGNECVVIDFAARILLYQGDTEYSSLGSSLSVTITGPIIRDRNYKASSLYLGDNETALEQAEKANVSSAKAQCTMDVSSKILVIANTTDDIEEYPITELTDFEAKVKDDNYSQSNNTERYSIYRSTLENALPASYTNPNLPDIRNQAPYGACWSFATTALVELSAIKNAGDNSANLAKNIDLSELQLAYYYNNLNGEDPLNLTSGDTSNNTYTGSGKYLNTGGNYELASNVLMNWIGSVNEDDVKYNTASTVLSEGLDNNNQYNLDQYHVKDVSVFDITTEIGRTSGKEFIKKNGGIAIAYYASNQWPFQFYSSTNNAYYCSSAYSSNHAVTIVGWDDNFSASNFNYSSSIPSGNGAWLVRNSWGGNGTDDQCYAGYFWLSYYDQSLGDTALSLAVDSADNYDNNYHYDGGLCSSAYAVNSKEKFAVEYTANANGGGDETVKAVSIGLASSDVNYNIKVFKNSSNHDDGELIGSASGKTDDPGSYTIPLDNPGIIESGGKISAVFELWSDDNSMVYVNAETEYTGSYTQMHANENSQSKCYFKEANVSGNTEEYDWYSYSDLKKTYYTDLKDLRVKVYTDNVYVPVSGISLYSSQLYLAVNTTKKLSTTLTPSNATDKNVVWSSDNPSVATVSNDGVISAVSVGEANIKISSDGISALCKVIVKNSIVSATGITLLPSSITLKSRETTALIAAVSPSDATDAAVIWKSSSPSVAMVDSIGNVTAVAAGEAKITATAADGGWTAVCTVTVTQPVTGVEIASGTTQLVVGETERFGGRVLPLDATDQNIKWSSSDNSIITIDNSGAATGHKPGQAELKITTEEGRYTATWSSMRMSVIVERSASLLPAGRMRLL